MVCLSEYLPLHSACILVIKVEVFVSRGDHESSFFFKCRLGLPVVRKVSGIVSMKSIDMYILHERSLVVCFSNMSTYFA